MEMHDEKIFRPYKVDSIGNDHVSVSLTKGRRTFMRVFFYLFPALLLIITYPVIWQVADLPLAFRMIYLGLIILISIALITKKVITAVVMDRYGVTITYMRSFQTNKQNFLWNEVEAIEVLTQGGKGGGAFYKLLVSTKKIEFLTIPVLQMNKNHVLSMNDLFKKISGKEVVVKGVYK